MKKSFGPTAILVLLLGTACATTSPQPVPSALGAIPIPRGMAYQPERSTIIESPSVRAAHLVYRGRLEPQSLREGMRSTLETDGWRHVSTSAPTTRGSVQVFEKAGHSLEVDISQGLWFTYLALQGSQASTPVAATGTGPTAPEPTRLTDGRAADGGAGTPASDVATGPAPTSPSAWKRVKEGGISFGLSVKNFFGSLFSN
jgi:hypothetical protein